MKKAIVDTASNAVRSPAVKKAGEALFFAGVIVLSSVAVIAVAFAAPIVLAASAVTGALTKKNDTCGWRPVSA